MLNLRRKLKANIIFGIYMICAHPLFAMGGPVNYETLLDQTERPTVSQVIELQENWKAPPLVAHPELLPLAEKTVSAPLHFDYPKWFQLLRHGAPEMIATFEQAFPGATWAFMGRDMAVIANLFEAFYLQLGQKNRVVTIEMSSPIIAEGLDSKLALKFLESKGLSSDEALHHPFILVDSISRHGGTQGRALLNVLYSLGASSGSMRPFGLKSVSEFPWWINMIGLEVSTTQLGLTPFNMVPSLLENHEKSISGALPLAPIFDPNHILVYSDSRVKGTYEGANEAGYTHWTGAWHGPFQKWELNGEKIKAIPGAPTPKEVRSALLTFQSHVITSAMSPEFLAEVDAAAVRRNYKFPTQRPAYVPRPDLQFFAEIQASSDEESIRKAVSTYLANSQGRVFAHFDRNVASLLGRIQTPDNFAYAVSLIGDPNLRDEAITDNLDYFFAMKPSATALNRISKLVPLTGPARKMLIERSIASATNAATFLSTLRALKQIEPDDNALIQYLDRFFSLAPNISEINGLISLATPNGIFHQKICVLAFQSISTEAEYNSLNKPKAKNFFSSLSKEYKTAKYRIRKQLNSGKNGSSWWRQLMISPRF